MINHSTESSVIHLLYVRGRIRTWYSTMHVHLYVRIKRSYKLQYIQYTHFKPNVWIQQTIYMMIRRQYTNETTVGTENAPVGLIDTMAAGSTHFTHLDNPFLNAKKPIRRSNACRNWLSVITLSPALLLLPWVMRTFCDCETERLSMIFWNPKHSRCPRNLA